jgi:hypothetical protein
MTFSSLTSSKTISSFPILRSGLEVEVYFVFSTCIFAFVDLPLVHTPPP